MSNTNIIIKEIVAFFMKTSFLNEAYVCIPKKFDVLYFFYLLPLDVSFTPPKKRTPRNMHEKPFCLLDTNVFLVVVISYPCQSSVRDCGCFYRPSQVWQHMAGLFLCLVHTLSALAFNLKAIFAICELVLNLCQKYECNNYKELKRFCCKCKKKDAISGKLIS